MARRGISSGSAFEAMAGYSRAVVDGDWVYLSGTTGYDYATGTISDDVIEQARQTFRNVEAALAEAGASLADVVQVRTYMTEMSYFELIAPVLKENLAGAAHTNAGVICDLIRPEIKFELEITAKKGG
jgi:enamine deaminase RidA (YjgF/YER057c/UK114 family)